MGPTHIVRRPQQETAEAPHSRARLVKADRPRAIDRYIDFFGGEHTFGGEHARAVVEDPCGERLLETFTDSDRETA